MTRLQLQTQVLSWLDDAQSGYFDPTTVNNWLNLAQRQVQMMLLNAGQNWYMKPAETFTVAGQADYILPSDFMFEHRIEIVLSGSGDQENRQALVPITTNQQDLISIVKGTPTNYYMKKNRITLSPTPSQQWTMRLYYSPRVADLANDTDVPDVPEQFMEFVAILAAFDGFIKDDRAPENLVVKKTKYEELLIQMSVDRTQDLPRQIVQVTDYDAGAWF